MHLVFVNAVLLQKQQFGTAVAVFDTAQQSAPIQFRYSTYQLLLNAAIKVRPHCNESWAIDFCDT